MLLRALHESVTGHTRLGRLEDFTFLAPSELLAATRTGGSQATLASRNLAPGGGYASGGVPVTGTLPELDQSRSAADGH